MSESSQKQKMIYRKGLYKGVIFDRWVDVLERESDLPKVKYLEGGGWPP